MVTAGGAETLPFLASCGVLPASLAFFVLYGRILDLHLQRSMARTCSLLSSLFAIPLLR
jgi:ATP/ADP translocase